MGSVIFKRPPLRKLRKEGMFGVDMHFHTMYSMDAISKIETSVKKAAKKGFGFAITDHNEIRGAILGCKLGREKGVCVMPGIEMTTKQGVHMLAYFYDAPALAEFYHKALLPKMTTPFKIELEVPQVIEKTKQYGGIACSPHPYAVGAVGIHKLALTKKVENSLNLIEVINGYNFRRSNLKAVYWASSINKAMTGGSDGHATLELGKTLTFTHGNDTEEIFKEVLKNKSVVIGKEDGYLLKAVMALRKESNFIKRSRKQHLTKKLIRSQLGPEYDYLKQKLGNGRIAHFLTNHHMIKASTKILNTKK